MAGPAAPGDTTTTIQRVTAMSVKDREDHLRSRLYIRVGEIEIDISGAQEEVDARMLELQQDDTWSTALTKVRSVRQTAIKATVNAARRTGLPERGAAFRSLVHNCNLTKKPDQVLAAINYLRNVEGVRDSPPRVVQSLFQDAGLEAPGNLSLYINRLRERGFLTAPQDVADKNRFVIPTPEGLAHLDSRAQG